MEYDLQLQKGGILVTKEWDKIDYLEKSVDSEDMIFHLNDSVCFERGLTLKDVFLLLSSNEEVFSVAAACPFLEDLISEAIAPSKRKEGFVTVEIGWIAYVDKKGYLYKRIDLQGVKVGDETDSLINVPINEISACPLSLNEEFVVVDSNLSHSIFSSKIKFTLSDVLRSITEELAFSGLSEFKELAMDDYNGSFPNAEEYIKKMNEQMASNVIPCRICNKDARSSHFNKPQDICFNCLKKIKEN